MTRRLIIKPEAEADAVDGFRWYQARQSELDERFLEELDAAFPRIVANPEVYQEVLPDIRRAVVHTFPYLVFFTFDRESVYILAVVAAAQDPQYISTRLAAGS